MMKNLYKSGIASYNINMWKKTDKETGIIRKLFVSTFIVQLVSMLSTTINSIIDGMVIGKCLGLQSMTAYGYVTPVILVVSALCVLMGAGTSGACGRAVGSGDKKEISNCFSSLFMSGAAIGIFCMLLVEIGSGPLAAVLTGTLGKAPNTYTELVQEYLIGFGFNIPFAMLMIHLSPITQFDGKPKLSIAALVTMSVTNAVLDVLNGVVFHGGMVGMALATSIASFLGFCVLSSVFFRKNHIMHFSFRGFRWHYARMLFSFGLSASVMMFAGMFTMFILNRLLGYYVSHDAVAALASVNSAGFLCTAIGSALRITVVTLTSMLEGERDSYSQMALMRIAVRAGIVLNFIVMCVIIACAGFIMMLFLETGTEPYEMSVTGLRIYALMMILFSMNMITSGYFQGKRKLKISVFFILLDKLICVSVFAWILVQIFGAVGVWVSFPLGSLLAMLISYVILCIRAKKLCTNLPDLFSVKEDKEIPDARFFIASLEESADVSAKVNAFCRDNGADFRSAFVLALATEELANNVISYGFREGQNNIVSVRITGEKDVWQLRMRDNCPIFDPEKYVRMYDDENPAEHIGIRLIAGMADRFHYFNSMNMNQILISVGK